MTGQQWQKPTDCRIMYPVCKKLLTLCRYNQLLIDQAVSMHAKNKVNS